nr:hypothetical protein [Tanacetum cinerariifolium]
MVVDHWKLWLRIIVRGGGDRWFEGVFGSLVYQAKITNFSLSKSWWMIVCVSPGVLRVFITFLTLGEQVKRTNSERMEKRENRNMEFKDATSVAHAAANFAERTGMPSRIVAQISKEEEVALGLQILSGTPLSSCLLMLPKQSALLLPTALGFSFFKVCKFLLMLTQYTLDVHFRL